MLKSKVLAFSLVLTGSVACLNPTEHSGNLLVTSTLVSAEVEQTQDCVTQDNPLIVIIGEDLSSSFTKTNGGVPIQVPDIAKICRHVAKTGRGGQITLGAVGDRTPKGYITCDLKPLPQTPAGAVISTDVKCKRLAQKVKAENEAAIQDFLSQCDSLLKNRNHKITDISGFFRKAKILASEPGASKCEIWLFVNSDGDQDIDPRKKESIDCSLRPKQKNVKFYVSGWLEENDNCNAHDVFLDPQQFVKFFQTQVKVQ